MKPSDLGQQRLLVLQQARQRYARWAAILAGLAVSSGGLSAVRGQPVCQDNHTAALNQAQSLFEQGQYARALSLIEGVYRCDHDPRRLLYLAQIHRKLGHRVIAADLARRYLASARSNSDREKAALDLLQAPGGVKNGEIALTGPAHALALVDNILVGVLPLSAPLLLDPGEHKLHVAPDGQPPLAKTVQLAAGERLDVDLAPPPPPPVVSLVPQAVARALPQREGRPAWRLATGATGAVASAGALAVGIAALVLNNQCALWVSCQIGYSADQNSVVQRQSFNTTGLGIGLLSGGIAVGAASVVLLALPGRLRAPLASLLPLSPGGPS